MVGSFRWHHLGTLILAFAVCIGFVGCGGGADPVDAIIKEEKAIMEEVKSGKVDPTKMASRQADLAKKIAGLSASQKEDYVKRKLGDAFKDFKLP